MNLPFIPPAALQRIAGGFAADDALLLKLRSTAPQRGRKPQENLADTPLFGTRNLI